MIGRRLRKGKRSGCWPNSTNVAIDAFLVSGAGNRVSKLHAGSCRLTWSSEREVSEASVRGAAVVAHGVPGNRAGEDICNQSSSMALTLHDLVRTTFAVSSRLLIAARRRLTAFGTVSALERLP
jgi:hypothetical protein